MTIEDQDEITRLGYYPVKEDSKTYTNGKDWIMLNELLYLIKLDRENKRKMFWGY